MSAYVLLYDGDCAFCRTWVERVARRDRRGRIRFVPFQEIDPASYGIERSALESAMHLVGPGGRVWKGAAAGREIARFLPGWRWAWYALGIPGALPMAQRAYDWAAHRRHRLGCGSAYCRRGHRPLREVPFEKGRIINNC